MLERFNKIKLKFQVFLNKVSEILLIKDKDIIKNKITMLERFNKIKLKFQVFLNKVIEILLIIKDFDIKAFNEKEKFCHNFKPKNDEQYFFFIVCAIIIWVITVFVLNWDSIIMNNQKFFIRRLGARLAFNIIMYIKSHKRFLTATKAIAYSLSLGFMLVIQLYEMMAYVIILNKMVPYIQSCTDKKEKFYFFLIIVFYISIVFLLNIIIYIFFVILVYIVV